MELIPIIKYALTVVSGISLIIVIVSYILYKVKSGKKAEETAECYSLVPAGNSSLSNNLPANNLFYAPDSKKTDSERKIRSDKPRLAATNKPGKRFMVLNEQSESYKYNPDKAERWAVHFSDDPDQRQGLNIFSKYSSNASEPLKKFSL
jgi:hypothetical protein